MTSETAIQNQVREAHCRLTNGQIWRNNSGAFKDETGRMIRFGLGNDSPQLNKRIKSSDLIGITPVRIEPHMVGYWLGVFTAYECKPSGWSLRPSDQRGLAQEKFLSIVKESCGYGGFVTSVEDMQKVIGR